MEYNPVLNKNLIISQVQVIVAGQLIASAYFVFLKEDNKSDEGDVNLYYASTGVITILTDTPGDVKVPVYYGDSFFEAKATDRNIRLANFALALELSCFHYPESGTSGSGVMPEKVSQVNLKAFLGDIGFTNVQINADFESEPKIDNIGVGIGSKVIDGKTVLAVAINGVHYTAQFGGNFKVGQSGTHEGFQLGADKVVEFIKSYISEKRISGDVKILLTGYSRGAAISNISSAMIDDAIAEGKVKDLLGNVNMSFDDLYGFGFMTPTTVPQDAPVDPTDDRYSNIFSYIDPNDVVPMVPPALYKFTHYGHVIKMPANDDELVPVWYRYVTNYFGEEVQKTYDRSTYKPSDAIKDLTEGEVMQEFLNRFVIAATDGERQTYYDKAQVPLSQGTYVMFTHIDMVPEMGDAIKANILTLALAYLSGEEQLKNALHNVLDGIFEKYQIVTSDGDQIVDAMTIIVYGVVKAAGGGTQALTDPYLSTIYGNLPYMLMPHMPSNICGWMYYLDPNYPESGLGR